MIHAISPITQRSTQCVAQRTGNHAEHAPVVSKNIAVLRITAEGAPDQTGHQWRDPSGCHHCRWERRCLPGCPLSAPPTPKMLLQHRPQPRPANTSAPVSQATRAEETHPEADVCPCNACGGQNRAQPAVTVSGSHSRPRKGSPLGLVPQSQSARRCWRRRGHRPRGPGAAPAAGARPPRHATAQRRRAPGAAPRHRTPC